MADVPRWSRGQLESVPRCPACGSKRRDQRAFARRDNEGMMPDVWRMARCMDCRSLWLDPRPGSESLPRAYDQYYTHGAESEDIPDHGAGGVAWRLIRGYLNRRFGMRRQPANVLGHVVFSLVEPWRLKLDYYGRHLTRRRFRHPGTLLDVGCGNGAFLGRAVEMGWNVAGCEPDLKAVAACRALGLDVVLGDAFDPAFDGRKFDVVTLSHVIEHVAAPLVLLRRIFDLLRSGGMFWMALPNPQSVGLRLFGSSWHGLHPPYHLCIPSQGVVDDWLRAAGFADIKFLRRGAHARQLWRISRQISRREAVPLPSPFRVSISRFMVDGLATLNTGRAEETVVLAHKPKAAT